MKNKKVPIALTVAGSDSGGGAGIQTDLKTFAALGVHGTSAITCLTAQNPRRVLAIQAATTKMVSAQIEAVFSELPPVAVKTGMLFSAEIIRTVADIFQNHPRIPLVVDPVMIATSGAALLRPDAVSMLQRRLLPKAALVTPNLPEAEVLIGEKIQSIEGLRAAAKIIHSRYGCAALVKGGHLRGMKEALDFLFDGNNEWLLSAPFIEGVSTHGTGCTYSAAIAGYLALGHPLSQAVALAKSFITQAIAQHLMAGSHAVLNNFYLLKPSREKRLRA